MSDLRVALRFMADSGNSRREIQALLDDMRALGKEGAKALGDESGKGGQAMNRAARAGAKSYKETRDSMREAAQGAAAVRKEVTESEAAFKEMGQAGRQAVRETKDELAKASNEGMQPLAKNTDKATESAKRMGKEGTRSLKGIKKEAKEAEGFISNFAKGLGKITGFSAGAMAVGVVANLKSRAQMDRQQLKMQQRSGMTSGQRKDWDDERLSLAERYGLNAEELHSGFQSLLGSGLDYEQAAGSIDAVARAAVVDDVDMGTLAQSLAGTAHAFDIDLAQPDAALDLIQKMTIASREGNVELSLMAEMLRKVGKDATKAGMSVDDTMSFIAAAGKTERDPARMAALVDSSLQTFTSLDSADRITKATKTRRTAGVRFYERDGQRRQMTDVVADLQERYQRLTTDREKEKFVSLIGGGEQMERLLSGPKLERSEALAGAAEVFDSDLQENLQSATAVAARMRESMRKQIDSMTQPITQAFAATGSFLMDDLGMSGTGVMATGAVLGAGGYALGKSIFGRGTNPAETMQNIAVGKVLEDTAGITPVFVTNWPTMGMGGMDGPDILGGSKKGPGGKPGSPSGKGVPMWGWVGLGLAAVSVGGASEQPRTDEGQLAALAGNKVMTDTEKRYYESYYKSRIALRDQLPSDLPEHDQQSWLTENARRAADAETGIILQDNQLYDPANPNGSLSPYERSKRGYLVDHVAKAQEEQRDPTTVAASLSDGRFDQGFLAKHVAKAQESQRDPASTAAALPAERFDQGFLADYVASALANISNGDNGEQVAARAVASLEAAEQRLAEILGQPLVVDVRSDSDMITAEVERRTGIQVRRGI